MASGMRRARSAAERLRRRTKIGGSGRRARSRWRDDAKPDSDPKPATSGRGLPHLALVRAPREPCALHPRAPDQLVVATYNLHRFTPARARRPNPELAAEVIGELRADVIALQEVLRPAGEEDPLERIAEELGLFVAFVATRAHRQGSLGNAVLSRFPITGALTLDLSFGRMERRSALAMELQGPASRVTVLATHLALVDRTRQKQVQSLLAHPQLRGPVVLLGDMNAWRRCPATRELDREFTKRHHNRDWPASFPSTRPTLALDRVYARGADVLEMHAHESEAARKASDHLPIIARLEIEPTRS